MKYLILVLVLLLLPFVFGVENGSIVSIKAVCVDGFGNVCSDSAYHITIDPDNITWFNNSICSNVAFGVWSCSYEANKTGIWWTGINFSSQNISREFNVVVEENKLGDVWTLSLVFGLVGLLGILFFVSVKLNKEHKYLGLFFFFMGVILISFLVFVMTKIVDDGGVLNALITVYRISVVLPFLVFVYFIGLFMKVPFFRLMDKVNRLRGK